MDRNKFLNNVTDWENHRHLLWLALEQTKIGSVLEFGCGDGSTPSLHEYCESKNRKLFSYDNDRDWVNKFSHFNSNFHSVKYVEHWNEVNVIGSVILIDHAPGERRIIDVEKFKDIPGILVLHDTQPKPTAAAYGYEKIWPLFKYIVHLDAGKNADPNIPDNRTWASAVSNDFDVTTWAGMETGNKNYKIQI